jgi:hypothetical protein
MYSCPIGALFYSLGRRALGIGIRNMGSVGAKFTKSGTAIEDAAPSEPDPENSHLGLGAPGFRITCRWHIKHTQGNGVYPSEAKSTHLPDDPYFIMHPRAAYLRPGL